MLTPILFQSFVLWLIFFKFFRSSAEKSQLERENLQVKIELSRVNAKLYDSEQKVKQKDARIEKLLREVNRLKAQKKNAKRKKQNAVSKQTTGESIQNGTSISIEAAQVVNVILIEKQIHRVAQWQCMRAIVVCLFLV